MFSSCTGQTTEATVGNRLMEIGERFEYLDTVILDTSAFDWTEWWYVPEQEMQISEHLVLHREYWFEGLHSQQIDTVILAYPLQGIGITYRIKEGTLIIDIHHE